MIAERGSFSGRGLMAATAALSLAATPAVAGTTTYAYDALGRLIATSTPNSSVGYTYDAAGNRVLQTISDTVPEAGDVTANVYTSSTNNPISLIIGGGTPTSVAISTGPGHGSATVTGTSITYTPAVGYTGSDSFKYTATNGTGTSAPATVFITVSTPLAPTSANASMSAPYNGAVNGGATLALPVGGAVTSAAVDTAPTKGTVTISGTNATYTSTYPAYGQDSFTYHAVGPGGQSATSTVSVTIANPAPPTAQTSNFTTAYNTAGAISIPGGGDWVSLHITSNPSHGTLGSPSWSSGAWHLTYTPTSNYYGSDSIQYYISNPGGYSPTATVNITVNPPVPVASAVSATVPYNSSGYSITPNVTSVVSLTGLTVTSNPSKGSVVVSSAGSLHFFYTPTTGAYGPDSFQYTASNSGGASAPATVSVTIQNASAPIANNYSSSVLSTSTLTFNPITAANDTDPNGYTLSVASITQPSGGGSPNATLSGNNITFNPDGIQQGTYSFTYTISNGHGGTATGTITIVINKASGGGGNA